MNRAMKQHGLAFHLQQLHVVLVAVAVILAAIATLSLESRAETRWFASSPPPIGSTPSSCAVTSPNGRTPPGESPSPLHHGHDGLWTALWPDGIVQIEPDQFHPKGALAMKWPWWRGRQGELTTAGHRLDASAPPLQSDIPEGYGATGFQASALIFPSEGCWEIIGTAGGASLTFVILVERVAATE